MSTTLNWLTFISLWFLALFAFNSNSLLAIHHILIVLPGIYFALTCDKDHKLNMSAKLLGLMILFVIGSVLMNWPEFSKPVKNLTRTKYFVIGFLAIFTIQANLETFLTKKRIRHLIHAFVFSTTFASSVGLISLLIGYNFVRMREVPMFRARGMFGMEMTYAHSVALFSTLIMTLLYFRKEIKEYIHERWLWIAFSVNTLGLFLTYTRGALLGFIFGAASLLFFRSKKLFIIGFTSLLLFLALGVFLTKDSGSSSRYFMAVEKSTNTRRVSQIITALYIFKDNPFFGVGFRNYQAKSKEYKAKYNIELHKKWSGHAHNNYLEILAGCGIFAFICLLLWHGFWLREAFWAKSLYPKLFGPFLVTWIVSGMTQSSIIDGENMFLIMGIYALSQLKVDSLKLKA